MKPAGQMTVTLTPELEAFVREQAKKEAYASSSEYIRGLIRERYLRVFERERKMKELDAALALGIAEADAGELIPMEEVFDELHRRYGPDAREAAE